MAESPLRILVERDLRPEYYDNFHCLAQNCRLNCCTDGWRIDFNKKDYLTLKRQKGSSDLNARLEHSVRRIRSGAFAENSYGEFALKDNVCPLLKDGICMLQKEKGEGVLPRVCRRFPRTEAYLPSGYLERSLSPACEGVLELLWDLPEGLRFYSDPLPKAERRSIGGVLPDTHLSHFQEIRSQCIDILQDRRSPLPLRILLMGMALRQLADGESDIPRWIAGVQAMQESQEEARLLQKAADDKTLSMFLFHNARVLLSLASASAGINSVINEVSAGIGMQLQDCGGSLAEISIPHEPWRTARSRFQEKWGDREFFMENLMAALFFHIRMPDLASSERLWASYVNFCDLYSFYRFMAVMSCREGAAGDRNELFRLLVQTSRGLLHNGTRQALLRDEFFKNDSTTLAHMAILLSN